jgi:phosphoglycerate dehydrogenase-like enzyme
MAERTIHVAVAIDFSDELMERIQAVSPRLHVTRYFPEVPNEVWAETEVLYTVRHFPEPEQAPRLRWIQLNYAGTDKVMHKRIVQSEDVLVTTASGIHAQPIANYCVMMMLAFNYKLPRMMREQQQKIWQAKQYDIYQPIDMHRQTLGIVGYGTIGRELARMAHAMGMRVLATKRDVKHPAETSGDYTPEGTGDPQGDIPERIYPGEALTVMVRECDYVVVTVPLTPANHHLINETVLNAMKPSAILINIARGAVVDESALVTALQNHTIAGAALDVFEEEPLPPTSPLWQLEQVIISPHVAGNSVHYHEKVADLFIENLRRYLEKRPLANLLKREVGY